ncbi:IS1 family transposase [Zooshikella sp. WH53]|uniref:IS1 family transposase n=2 Tax=Zooshikella harenae TaxID=2827238 RepID=A0ABS5ZIV1_9GAMM|nr:IS1 family transposase [Zooshikella harenae]
MLNEIMFVAVVTVFCNKCGNNKVKKIGLSPQGKQRYLCKNQECKKSFILDYTNNETLKK